MISIVIPVFNEEDNLDELNSRLSVVCESLDDNYEIIYVDDSSSDNSLEIIKKYCSSNEHIHYISFYRNFGQHAAVMAGFKYTCGEIIITLDADLQNPPEEIPKFLEKMKEGFDVVAGKRVNRKDKLSRIIPSYFINKFISSLTGVKLNDYGCMMRAYRRDIINKLLQYGEKSLYITAFTSWLSQNTIEIPIKHDSRFAGNSKYSLLSLLRQVFDLVTTYSLVPIQLIGIIGFVLFVVGIFLFLYLMYHRMFIAHLDPLTSFIAILIFLSGVILFSIGIVSEYLVRLYKEVRSIPLYILKESDKNIQELKGINDSK
jgi:undecaprenyl-phosphate 4-deoxy-4-formamido-L-arabinose transferase